MKFFVFCLFLGAAAAEAPFSGYAASGWRPEGAQFRLPHEYGAPLVQQKVEVEVTKENVAHAAQIVEETTQYVSNEYLPATTTDLPELDPILVQGLPNDNQFKDFQRSNLQQQAKVSTSRRVNSAPQQPQLQQQHPIFPLSGQFRALPSNNFQFGRQEQAQTVQGYAAPDQDNNGFVQRGQLRALPARNFQFGRQEQAPPTQTYGAPHRDNDSFAQNGQVRALPTNNFQFGRQEQTQPVQTYGAPDQDNNSFAQSGQLRALPVNNFQFGRQEQAQPAQTYGVPDQDNNGDQDLPETDQPEEPQTTNQPDADSDDDDNDQTEQAPKDGRTVIAISNAFSGQYYILGPDNNLQRVMYSTSESDADMGFTAQLRYSSVEPIRGPVYAYNEQGQLVKIYK